MLYCTPIRHLTHQKLLKNLSVFKLRRLHIYVSETRGLKLSQYGFEEDATFFCLRNCVTIIRKGGARKYIHQPLASDSEVNNCFSIY